MAVTILLIKKIISLFIIMMVGVLMVRLKLLKPEDSKPLSVLMLYAVVPCTILNAFQVDYTPNVLRGLALTVACATFTHLFWLVLIKLLEKTLKTDVIENMSIMYTNAGNLIIPIVTSVLGEDMVIYSVGYMGIQLIFMWTHLVSQMRGSRGFDFKKIITNVNLIVVFIGIVIFLTQFKFPSFVQDALSSISSTIGPLAMIVIGMLIGGIKLKEIVVYRRVWLVTFLRLIVFPLTILLILKLVPLWTAVDGGKEILLVFFLACVTPSASTVTQMAQVFENDARYASAINVISTLASLVTMPLMVMLYQL